MLFVMLQGHYPFHRRPGDALAFQRMLRGELSFKVPISSACEELLRGMLVVDTGARMTMEEVGWCLVAACRLWWWLMCGVMQYGNTVQASTSGMHHACFQPQARQLCAPLHHTSPLSDFTPPMGAAAPAHGAGGAQRGHAPPPALCPVGRRGQGCRGGCAAQPGVNPTVMSSDCRWYCCTFLMPFPCPFC